MINQIKLWFQSAQFWIGVAAVAFFFGMAMNAQHELGKAHRALEKAKTELAVQKAEKVGLKAGIESQNLAIDALSTQTTSTLTALTIALANADKTKAVEDKKIQEVEALPPTSDCEKIRERMINYAIQQ
jgi:hypothetical protein